MNVAGTSDIIIDVAVVHEFHGSVAQPDRHGQLRHPNPDKVLIDKAVTKVQGNAYRQDYLHNHNKAFLPLIMSTSDRLHLCVSFTSWLTGGRGQGSLVGRRDRTDSESLRVFKGLPYPQQIHNVAQQKRVARALWWSVHFVMINFCCSET